jgi:hypothetical protein
MAFVIHQFVLSALAIIVHLLLNSGNLRRLIMRSLQMAELHAIIKASVL